MITEQDLDFMRRALELAEQARALNEVPVGALVVFENTIISQAYNQRETLNSALAHAEVTALSEACRKLGRWRLTGCTLYVTLEPCVMCAGALIQSRIDRVVYGTPDPKAGAVESLYQVLADPRLNHRPVVAAGALAAECGDILRRFFKDLRQV